MAGNRTRLVHVRSLPNEPFVLTQDPSFFGDRITQKVDVVF